MRTVFFILCLLAGATVSAQRLDSLLELQRLADPREKIHLHFDKASYNPGETIWFKAYLFSGIGLSDESRNLYAEMLDGNGKLLERVTAPIVFAGASGSFMLDSSYARPVVYVRAYTLGILRSDTTFIYNKAIRILGKTSPTATASTTFNLSFLPEGGNWVAGVPAMMAFIATDSRGLPAAATGFIEDAAGTKLTDFRTVHNGMGSVLVLPQAGKRYRAQWKDERGKQHVTALPEPAVEGIALRITDETAGKRFTITRSANIPSAQQRLHVVATMNQHLLYQADVSLATKTVASGVFPIEPLISGLMTVTVFDSSYRPLLERVCFVNKHDYEFDGDVYLTQKNAAARTLNRFEISVSDTLPANLSVSITDADRNETVPMDDNIVSRMLLTGDLRGPIVNPYYYFYSNSDSVGLQLDLVLLTHGWRRFNWDDVWAGRVAARPQQPENYLTLQGQVQGLPPGRMGGNLQLNGILETADSVRHLLFMPVDRKGSVSTDGVVFYDTARFYFSFNDKNIPSGTGLLQLQNGLMPAALRRLPDTSLARLLPNATAAQVAANTKALTLARQRGSGLSARELANIVVKGRSKPAGAKMEQRYVSALFAGDATSFDLTSDLSARSYSSLFQYLQGKVAGMMIDGGSPPSLSWRGSTPALYLNEMQSDAAQLSVIPMSDVAYVKVFRPGESPVYGGGGGVIAVYTRKGGDAVSSSGKGLSSTLVMGYTAPREFFSPDYATDATSVPGDFRSTLYWNPTIYVDKSRRKIRLQFYNNDITRNFRLVLEGVDGEGRVLHVEKRVSADAK
ncbi:MAG: hypothetical protein EOO15_12680 [Chitinophagaceae bacterium]|nr:MAG: hypothetical protein EOO15_12680 [Chitinophagaceae bacterium]